ncbi:MAG: hypothetical protein IJN25_01150 [Clostridia bacterium]|nr:hypothetical protein [Clostridia bacterium]
MKHTKRNLALGLCMLLLCMAFAPLGVAAESTNLIENGSMDEEDWYYTQGPAGWSLNKTADVWSKTVEEHGKYLENGGTQKTAYIYHQTGGINNSPYVEIDAVTYASGDGDPKIKLPWIEDIEGDTWYTLTFYSQRLDNTLAPKVAMTFASDDALTVGSLNTSSGAIGTGLLGYNYKPNTWLKYQIRFKAPSWAWKVQMTFGGIMKTSGTKVKIAYDNFSLCKDESGIEYMEPAISGVGGASAWPYTSLTLTDDNTTVMPIAVLYGRIPYTVRPADGKVMAAFYYNAGASTENVTCISAVYKKTAEGTTLVNCYIDEMVRAAEINRLEQEITLPEAAEGVEYTVKSYIWSSMTGLAPLGVSNSFTY